MFAYRQMGPGAGSVQSIMVPDPVSSKTYGPSEFLDMNLSQDSNLLLHAIHSLFYWQIFTENHTSL
jgi:hypothetical protein